MLSNNTQTPPLPENLRGGSRGAPSPEGPRAVRVVNSDSQGRKGLCEGVGKTDGRLLRLLAK